MIKLTKEGKWEGKWEVTCDSCGDIFGIYPTYEDADEAIFHSDWMHLSKINCRECWNKKIEKLR